MDPNKSKVDERKGLVLSPSGREVMSNTFSWVNTGCFAIIIFCYKNDNLLIGLIQVASQ